MVSTSFKKPNLNAPRVRHRVYNFHNQDFFDEFRKLYPEYESLSNKVLRDKLSFITDCVKEQVLNTRDGIELPLGLGYIFLGSCQKKINPNPDMIASYEHNKIISHKNYESDQYLAKIFYTTFETKYRFKYHNTWGFKPCRKFKRAVKPIYIENYTRYIKIDNFIKISTIFRKNNKRMEESIKNEELLLTYNDLEI